jgi:hypothetical protein
MIAQASPRSGWTATLLPSRLSSAVTDLVLIYESLISGLRMTNYELRMNVYFSARLLI